VARVWRYLRYPVYAIAVLLLMVAVLPVVYRFGFVHPISTLMIRDLAIFDTYERDWVDIENVAPVLIQSVVMSEDGQFCNHHGIDWREMQAVIGDALDGEATRGASTITMQTAKNLFLWSGRSFIRKVVELPVAVWIDIVMPKKRIMEIYLNIAEWGDGIYGIEAASWAYFGRPALDLTAGQAALMAAALPNPYLRNPAKPGANMRRVAQVVERRARKSGAYVTCFE
jgi:monofunctional biosynthetic peptidoglycan transglycosylase